MGVRQGPLQARQSGQQTEVRRHRRRRRTGRRGRRGIDGGARLQRAVLRLPRLAAARALHRRAGRHQRRQELSERRRQHLPPLLRHGQRRRLPLARSERLSPRGAERQHHRSGRRAGRAVRARVRRHCSRIAPSAACRSREPSTRAARPDSNFSSARSRRWSARSHSDA